jgi:hypothetical protein
LLSASDIWTELTRRSNAKTQNYFDEQGNQALAETKAAAKPRWSCSSCDSLSYLDVPRFFGNIQFADLFSISLPVPFR